ncbi:MAG: imidazolonepropionase [Acidobacteria bacterium]|nr:imidazolonepropionase [Acidobacteriota bacterium]MCA1636724.1 imidazolonepropionase [Acidobacteriota bacterium]
MKVDLIIHNAKQLVTCASSSEAKKGALMRELSIVENGAVAIKDRKIVSVGKSDEVLHEFSTKETIDAKGKVVCPAFVECHTHIVFAGNRLNEFELKIKGADYLEILENGGGIISTVSQTRKASLKDLVQQSVRRLDQMLKLGTATAEIKTGYGLDLKTELKMLDAIAELDKIHAVEIVPTFLGAHAIPPEYREVKRGSDDYIDLICEEMLPIIADLRQSERNYKGLFKNKPFFVDVFCEKNAFNRAQSKRVLETAKSLGFGLKAHVDEFTNLGGAQMAIELGATSIDHLDVISDEEIEMLVNSNTIGVITPTVNFNFGSCEFADVRKMIDAGCAIALSTDFNPGSAPCPSLPNAMAIACRYQKLLPCEALNASTINAAFAIGLSATHGSIEIGKQADILILDTDDYRQLAYEFGWNLVETLIKGGKKII